MTTENNFTATAETFKDNVTKSMKWMQDANAKLVETQKQQMKTVTDLFSKSSTGSQFGVNNLNAPFGDSSKAINEIVQKNIETITNFMKTTLKPVTDLTKLDKDALTNEAKKQFDTLTQQAADLAIVNQTNLDTVLKQIETTSKSFTPLNEQYKKEIEKAVESSKETLQTIVESYTTFAAPSMEANKETLDKLTEQLKSSVNANVKFWSDLMNPTSATTTEKTAETKVDSNLLKISATTAKKQATANVNHN